MINELYKDKLATLADDEILLKAIKEVFNERIEQEKPEVREGQDNALLGEKYRAYEKGKEIIEKGFTDLLSYKASKEPIKSFNKSK